MSQLPVLNPALPAAPEPATPAHDSSKATLVYTPDSKMVGTSLAVPGLGLVIAGPIAAALAGAGAGAATGGLVGVLVGAGIPEHRAKVYDADVREGGILVGVEAGSDKDVQELEGLMEDIGARHVRQA